jgi:hypothetical protein
MSDVPDDLSGMAVFTTAEETLAECRERGWLLVPQLWKRDLPDGREGVMVKTVDIGFGSSPLTRGADPLNEAVRRFQEPLYDLLMAEPGPLDVETTLATMDPELRAELSEHARRLLHEAEERGD